MAKTGILIQARTSSQRLPGKVLKNLPSNGSITLIEQIYARLSSVCDTVAILVPREDVKLIQYLSKVNIPFMEGPLEDVRERYRMAARYYKLDVVVRATGDNPCVDADIVRDTIHFMNSENVDLFSYSNLPLGCAVEAFTSRALFFETEDIAPEYKEHVSLHIKHHPEIFHIIHRSHPSWTIDHAPRLTVDEERDYQVVDSLFQRLGNRFGVGDILNLYFKEPEFFELNRDIIHNYFNKEDKKN